MLVGIKTEDKVETKENMVKINDDSLENYKQDVSYK